MAEWVVTVPETQAPFNGSFILMCGCLLNFEPTPPLEAAA